MRWLVLTLAVPFAFAQHNSAINPAKVIDLTYTYDESTVYWPTSPPFVWKQDAWGKSSGYWYASGTFTTSEHGGTHIDSPIHFGEGKRGTSDIPVDQLVGAACVIDVSAATQDYIVPPDPVLAWEKQHGTLHAGDIVLFRTGWGKRWPNKKAYLGTDKPGDVEGLRFPGIASQTARLLVVRGVSGVGIDTASIDYGRSKDFPTHRVLNGANLYALENVANLEKLPVSGATVIALPVKTKGGTGGPVRIVAILP